MHFLAGFSRPFALALGLWPIASLVLTLPVLAILYRRDGRLRLWSAVGAYLSVLYLLSLVCFTLYPLPSGDSGLGITWIAGAPLLLYGQWQSRLPYNDVVRCVNPSHERGKAWPIRR